MDSVAAIGASSPSLDADSLVPSRGQNSSPPENSQPQRWHLRKFIGRARKLQVVLSTVNAQLRHLMTFPLELCVRLAMPSCMAATYVIPLDSANKTQPTRPRAKI